MPAMQLDVIEVGEKTGNLGNGMDDISKAFRSQLTKRIKAMPNLISGLALGFAFHWLPWLLYQLSPVFFRSVKVSVIKRMLFYNKLIYFFIFISFSSVLLSPATSMKLGNERPGF